MSFRRIGLGDFLPDSTRSLKFVLVMRTQKLSEGAWTIKGEAPGYKTHNDSSLARMLSLTFDLHPAPFQGFANFIKQKLLVFCLFPVDCEAEHHHQLLIIKIFVLQLDG